MYGKGEERRYCCNPNSLLNNKGIKDADMGALPLRLA